MVRGYTDWYRAEIYSIGVLHRYEPDRQGQAGGRSITLVLPLEQVQVDCFTALDLATLLEHPSASFIDIRANLSPISALIE
jgi:hypothetical protein